MRIKEERISDIDTITRIQYAAFKDHPQHPPGAEPVEHRIVEALRGSGGLALSLLAEVDGKAVGHIAMSPASVGGCREGWFLLGPIGVLPEHQGKGIGSALTREALQRLRENRAAGIVLVGDPGFYGRFGFGTFPKLIYPGVPDQYVLALPFTDGEPAGDIVAHAAFNVVEK